MSSQDEKLTLEQAYCAMFFFLEKEYEITKSDDFGGLLSSLDWTIWTYSSPADPAAWGDWLEAIKKMKSSSSIVQVKQAQESKIREK